MGNLHAQPRQMTPTRSIRPIMASTQGLIILLKAGKDLLKAGKGLLKAGKATGMPALPWGVMGAQQVCEQACSYSHRRPGDTVGMNRLSRTCLVHT